MSTAAATRPRLHLATRADRDRRAEPRSHAERILALAEHLPQSERLLLAQAFEHGESIADLARLRGEPVRELRRRVGRLLRRLHDPLFPFVIAHAELLDPQTRRTADAVVLQGLSMRHAARRLRLSLHEVRQDMRAVRALARF